MQALSNPLQLWLSKPVRSALQVSRLCPLQRVSPAAQAGGVQTARAPACTQSAADAHCSTAAKPVCAALHSSISAPTQRRTPALHAAGSQRRCSALHSAALAQLLLRQPCSGSSQISRRSPLQRALPTTQGSRQSSAAGSQ